ncbi:hypothetical protein [Subtercola boreus]|uniref:hypothetical protein n=1 Tax=Subtercola boreus TaxID=120213 RepID=UPI0011C03B0D|nr:hypothetical protein [Subtercola boreus]
MSQRKSWVAAVLAAVGVLVSFVLLRWAAIELFATARRTQFQARPELENWANPYSGLELQGSVTAFITLLTVVLVVALARHIRRRALTRADR